VCTEPGLSTGGGVAYGSVYKPALLGGKGGGDYGGLGGGKLYIRVPAEFLLDGIILADGAAGGTGSGGGSGGSVWIESGMCALGMNILGVVITTSFNVLYFIKILTLEGLVCCFKGLHCEVICLGLVVSPSLCLPLN